ncbi:MAG: ABC transporter substrate-binding protein [Acetobacteraceae bacterium]|nr:ABC transporter substrate-binding protein [Acetobacteraceae bacterium]
MMTGTKWVAAATLALALLGGGQAEAKVTLSIGGASCLCYLPTVLAQQLGLFEKAGVEVDTVDFKGGSQALTAVIGGSADVVSGYFDHTVELAAKQQNLTSFVVYDRFPGLVLVVAPGEGGSITKVSDLAGKKVGVSAPGSSTDFFLKYELKKAGLKPDAAAVVGVGLGATAVAAMEHGQIDAAVMLDPAVTILQTQHKDLKILVDTRSEADTMAAFGGAYPGGALYARADWIAGHAKEVQAMTDAMLETLQWIHTHSAEEIMAKMPPAMVGKDKDTYLAALKQTIPMYSQNGLMDPKGAQAVLEVFSVGDPSVAQANINLQNTYTNKFVEDAKIK